MSPAVWAGQVFETSIMPDTPLVQVRPDLVDGVLVVDLLPREITEPDIATLMGQALRAAFDMGVSKRMLINIAATKYLSSTAFAVLLKFGLRVAESGGKLAICAMDEFVHVGAKIVRLGQIVPILDDEPTAIAALNA
jgi:anti-anti-sigma factor